MLRPRSKRTPAAPSGRPFKPPTLRTVVARSHHGCSATAARIDVSTRRSTQASRVVRRSRTRGFSASTRCRGWLPVESWNGRHAEISSSGSASPLQLLRRRRRPAIRSTGAEYDGSQTTDIFSGESAQSYAEQTCRALQASLFALALLTVTGFGTRRPDRTKVGRILTFRQTPRVTPQ